MIRINAELIFPISSPPIQDGSILINQENIFSVRSKQETDFWIDQKKIEIDQTVNLPKTAILPGFVNAHSHLELTALKNLSYPGSFTEWIKKVVHQKTEISDAETRNGIRSGIKEMLQSGITTIGDHVSSEIALEELVSSPLKGRLFLEVLGVTQETSEESFRKMKELKNRFLKKTERFDIHLTAHAAHSVHFKTIQKIFEENETVYSIHLAESEEEDLFFRNRSGLLFDFIQERGWREFSFPFCSALELINHSHSLNRKILVIHGNYFEFSEIKKFKNLFSGIIHCPTSHSYFQHRNFPKKYYENEEVPIGLGTDSLSSGSTLSMSGQWKKFLKKFPSTSQEELLYLSTLGGAKALRMDHLIGSIEKGKKGDLIGFVFKEEKNLWMNHLNNHPETSFLMINGKVITDLNENEQSFSKSDRD